MEFKEIEISETDIEIIDGDRGKNYPTKSELFDAGHTLFLNNKNIINNFLDDSFGEYITEEKDNMLRKGKLNRNDIVLSTRGSVGNVGLFSDSVKTENIRINSGMVILRNNDDKFINEFIYIALRSQLMQNRIKESISGSVQNQLPIRDLKKIKFIVPSLEIQRKIIDIVNSYDKKIETNNKIIANLEAQAQALFKYYFIDFEPFADGNFVDSVLGPIPEGWEVSDIKNMSRKVVTGKTPSTKKKEYFGNHINFVKIPDMHGKIYSLNTEVMLSEEGMRSQSKKTIPKDSILVSCIATVGLVNIASKEVQTNQQINSIIPKASNMRYYLYFVMRNMNKLLDAIGSSGSTTKNINKRTFENINLIKPDEKTLDEFDNLILPFFECIKLLYKQNQTLAQARDALLPRLMAGEIDLEGLGGSYD